MKIIGRLVFSFFMTALVGFVTHPSRGTLYLEGFRLNRQEWVLFVGLNFIIFLF